MRNFAYIAACAGFFAALCGASESTLAQDKKYQVSIDSEPQGAEVWIDDREGEPVGTTPYSTRLGPGKHTVFLELSGYEVVAEEIRVKKRRRGKQTFKIELVEQSMGSIDVLAADDAEHTDGAKVLLDGKEVGTVPDSFEAAAGSHKVEVVKDGYKRFASEVDVAAGDSVELTVALEQGEDEDEGDDGKGKGDDGKGKGDDGDGSEPEVERSGPLLTASAGLGSGIRRFRYNNRNANNLGDDNLLPYVANGLALANVSAELHFGRMVSALDRFSLFGGVSLTLLGNSVAANGTNIATTWLRREVGLRARFGAGGGHLGVDVAEGGNDLTFDPNDVIAAGVVQGIAETTYEYLRLGVWYGRGFGKVDFGVGAGGLLVLASGGVSERFADPGITGFSGNTWIRVPLFAGIEGGLTGSLTYFAYTLQPAPELDADGGYDLMLDIIGSAGYRF